MERAIVLTLLLVASAAVAQDAATPPMYESFEAGVPAEWVATRADSLSRSDAHSKHGAQLLRWDWRAGEEIAVAHGIGDVTRKGGYGGYHKAAFAIWLYCEEPTEGAVELRFEAGGQPGGSFRFPLGFTGWRRAVLHYRWRGEFDGTVPADTDTIRIIAPQAGEGALFIDLVVYNGIVDYRQASIPERQFVWRPVDADEVRTPAPKPDALTPEIEAGLAKIAEALDPWSLAQAPISDERMGEHRERFEAQRIVRDERGIRGAPLVVRPELYETAGVPDAPPSPAGIASSMREMAASYHYTTDAAQREQLAGWYLLMADHLADQGFVAGSGNRWGSYAGRKLADAMLWMREPMRAAGRGEREAAYFDYNWRVSAILDADAPLHVNLDELGVVGPRQLRGAIMRPDPLERAQWIACFADMLSRMILLQTADGFKPDGSAYHHGAHYMAYAGYNVPVMIGVLGALDDTPWEVSSEALARVKLYLMNLRFYSNLLDVPFAMHGRHPFRGGANRASIYRVMAQAGPGTGEADFDPELAAAYLRLLAEPPAEEPFPGHEVTAEPHPTGNLTMPYAGITAQRRDDWLAVAHANTRWFWSTEIYDRVNAYGSLVGLGDLTLLAGAAPVSLASSGYMPEGWDWSRFDGSTAPHLPVEVLCSEKRGTRHTRIRDSFGGGLSHRGRDGVLVSLTEGPDWAAPGLRAVKSYAFLGDRIICLGSGIAADDAGYPIVTNLFQRALPEPDAPITVDDEALTGLAVTRDLAPGEAHWLIDTIGTGFVTAPGARVHVERAHQLSRDKDDTKDTEGDFASAWLDHGVAPENAGYEYAVVMRATPERMAAIAAGDATWEVLQRDERAHIVRDLETGTLALVLLQPGEVSGELPVANVDRRCLLMLEPDGDGWWLSVSDADLNLNEQRVSVPRELRVTLRGAWWLVGASKEMTVASQVGGMTTISVMCHDGAGFEGRLVR